MHNRMKDAMTPTAYPSKITIGVEHWVLVNVMANDSLGALTMTANTVRY